jgi:uncharacterized protein (DUF302 family)
MIVSSSPASVKDTVDSIEGTLREKGLTIFARIDHASAAREVDLEMQDEEVLIFGNPKAGTMLMKESPAIGLELPLKIVAWANDDGTTSVGYTDPAVVADRYGISDGAGIIANVAGLLEAVTP